MMFDRKIHLLRRLFVSHPARSVTAGRGQQLRPRQTVRFQATNFLPLTYMTQRLHTSASHSAVLALAVHTDAAAGGVEAVCKEQQIGYPLRIVVIRQRRLLARSTAQHHGASA